METWNKITIDGLSRAQLERRGMGNFVIVDKFFYTLFHSRLVIWRQENHLYDQQYIRKALVLRTWQKRVKDIHYRVHLDSPRYFGVISVVAQVTLLSAPAKECAVKKAPAQTYSIILMIQTARHEKKWQWTLSGRHQWSGFMHEFCGELAIMLTSARGLFFFTSLFNPIHILTMCSDAHEH